MLELDPVEAYGRLMLGRALECQGRAEEAATQPRIAAAFSGEPYTETGPGRVTVSPQ